MAKKKGRATRIVVEAPEEPEVEEKEQAPPPAVDEDVEELLSQVPQEARAELWRWGEASSQDWDYVGRFPVIGFSLDMVRDRFGPGKYRLIVRGPREDESGKVRVVQLARRHFSIAGAATGAAGNAAGNVSMLDLLRFQMQMMQTMAQAPRENMAELVRAIHDLSAPKSDPLQTAVQLLQLVQGKEKAGLGEVLEVLQMGMDLGERVAEKEDSLGVFAKAFTELITKLPTKPGAAVAQVGGASAAEPKPEIAPSQVTEVKEWIQGVDAVMAPASRSGGDVEEWAEWLLDQIEQYRPEMASLLPAWFADPGYPSDMVLGLFARSDRSWLRAVLLKLRELAQTPPEDEEDAES